nr:MAG TPA: hypothetical protein [Caudoviricetes sp.]
MRSCFCWQALWSLWPRSMPSSRTGICRNRKSVRIWNRSST